MIRATGIRRKVPPGTTIFSQESPCIGLPLVLRGSIEVVQHFPNGRELQLYRVLPGEACLLSNGDLVGRSSNSPKGIAQTTVDLIIVPPAVLQDLLARDYQFVAFVFEQARARLGAGLQLVEKFFVRTLDQRLAHILSRVPGATAFRSTPRTSSSPMTLVSCARLFRVCSKASSIEAGSSSGASG